MSTVPDFVPDNFAISAVSIDDEITALAALGVTVVRTDTQVELDFYHVRMSDMTVPATVGHVTVSVTGRLFVELFDLDDHLTRVVLLDLEQLVAGERRSEIGWTLTKYLTREYAEAYLAEQVFRCQLNDAPNRCRHCNGRMAKRRFGMWLHKKCESKVRTWQELMAGVARERMFKATTPRIGA